MHRFFALTNKNSTPKPANLAGLYGGSDYGKRLNLGDWLASLRAMAQSTKENPLHNFLLNVLLPVLALGVLSKDAGKPWHIGPIWGMVLAVALPLGYGIWFYLRTRKTNAFSIIGFGSVLLTGGITLMSWRPDGSIHPQAAQMFALKEASIPMILGLCVCS